MPRAIIIQNPLQTNAMLIPEPDQQYHTHGGLEVPVYPLSATCNNLAKHQSGWRWARGAHCEFTESPVAERRHLEAMMGLAITEGEVEPPDREE